MPSPLGKWSTPTDVVAAMRLASPAQLTRLAASTVIVTGANTGIGKETARALRRSGSFVVYACRNLDKGEAAVADADGEPGKAVCLPLDLSDLASVRSFRDEFLTRGRANRWPPLSCLVLNAGLIGLGGMSCSRQNVEMTFAVNHLGHWLLTKLLLPALRSAAPSRVVVVASNSSFGPLVTKSPERLADENAWMRDVVTPSPGSGSTQTAARFYGTSKLCNILFAQELHRQETKRGSGVAALALHPGSLILTDIARGSWIASFAHRYIVSWWTKSAEQGAATTLYGCCMPHEEIVGQYLDDCAERRPPRLARGEAGARAGDVLEKLSAKLCRSFL